MQWSSEIQMQHVFRRCSRKRPGSRTELSGNLPAISQSVILHQVHHPPKLAEKRPSHYYRVEDEVAVRVLDAQVRRAEFGFHGQGEEVTRVRAVPHEKGAVQSLG